MTSERDLRILEALETARRQNPALVDLFSFAYDLCQVQFQAKAGLPGPGLRDEKAMRWRLEGGIPQVTFDQLGVEPRPFASLVREIAGLLVLHNHPAAPEREPQWTPENLVSRAREIVENWDTLTVPRPSCTGLVEPVAGSLSAQSVGFALAPYLQRAAERILPHLDQALWSRGYCLICGGRPNLALLAIGDGPRQLVCSRCAAAWGYAGATCTSCESESLQLHHVSNDGLYHLYVCPVCKDYLKAVALSRTECDVYPQVECLRTVGLDLIAGQAGYSH